MPTLSHPSPAPAAAASTLASYRRELNQMSGLAGPVVATQLGMMLLGTVDVMMLGRLDEVSLAAGALGNTVSFALMMLPMGLLFGLDPLVAQAHGAGRPERVARFLRHGVLLAAVLAAAVSALMWDTRWVLDLLGQKPEVAAPASAYLRLLIPGNLAFLEFVVVRQTMQAMSVVWPAVLAMLIGNLVNVAANYALIFGHWGSPQLGVLGSAVATSISRWVILACLVLFMWPWLRRYVRQRSERLSLSGFRRIFAIGGPVAVQISLEHWVFATVAVLMGTLGSAALAGHQVSLSWAALTFMVPLGIAGASATRVGNAVGRGDQEGAKRAAIVGLAAGGAVMGTFAVAFLTVPGPMARVFTAEPRVLEVAIVLLPIAGVFQVADGLQVVGAGVLRGTADTRLPALIAFFGYWLLGLPTGLWLAYRAGYGPRGLWWGLTLGLAVVAVLFLIRIRARFRSHIAALA